MKDGEIVLEVLYPRARVARYMPDGKGGMVVEYADPQPPVVVLLAGDAEGWHQAARHRCLSGLADHHGVG
jgi:hypothetical protein